MNKFVVLKTNNLMKRVYLYGISMMLMLCSTINVWAQTDDVYYDPSKDAGYSNQNSNQNQNSNYQNGNENYDNGYNNNQNYQQPTDKTDGYDNPAYRYDDGTQSSSTSQYSDGSGNTDHHEGAGHGVAVHRAGLAHRAQHRMRIGAVGRIQRRQLQRAQLLRQAAAQIVQRLQGADQL